MLGLPNDYFKLDWIILFCRWLGVWIEMVSSCIVFASAVFAILTPNISGGQAGLSVTYALQVNPGAMKMTDR